VSDGHKVTNEDQKAELTKERWSVTGDLLFRDALHPQPGASTGISPSGPGCSARRNVVVLALEEFEELVPFELGVGANVL
jgi:hypothetical protein